MIDPALDHLVYASPDLPAAVSRIAALTGLEPVEGGPHPGRGTRNFLLGLGHRAYLEIIGPDPDQPAPSGPRPFGIDGLEAPALVGWALAVEPGRLDERAARAREAGFDPGRPAGMSRHRPDGTVLAWRLTPMRTGPLPFLIDWGDAPHPADGLPVVPLRSLEITHPEPETVRTALAVLGAAVPVRAGERPALHAELDTAHGTFTLT
ncbi:VOC family protein [Sphaerisporangium fuscum]|uniref:VOC family protein n=1 Tax=Sphaerisporangium fuscum TaxID=2835868 RepID=UPI001BDD298C|nr:VOC family protein [Sphaerisporangium fuscum]